MVRQSRSGTDTNAPATAETPVRLDKWLWAARFYRTRSLAKTAIESAHVRIDGQRCKVSRTVSPGLTLTIRQGWDEVEVVVRALSDQRSGAPQAQRLYEETAASLARREQAREQRIAAREVAGPGRPTKQQRRALHRFKRGQGPDS